MVRGKGGGAGSLVRQLAPGSSIAFAPDLSAAIVRARQINGRFAPGGSQFHTLLVQAHRRMAEKAQEYVVESLEQVIQDREGGMRPQRSTHYLLEALKNPKVIDYNIDRFIVGTDYLDQSPARPYYRNLEEGTNIFVGRTVRAVFTNDFYRNRVGPYPNNGRLDVRMIQYPVTGYTHQRGRNPADGPFLFQIRHPIQARHYFRNGIKRFTNSGFITTTYDSLKQELLAR